jgi:hypothetical protein
LRFPGTRAGGGGFAWSGTIPPGRPNAWTPHRRRVPPSSARAAWPEVSARGTHAANMKRALAFALGFALAAMLALALYPA